MGVFWAQSLGMPGRSFRLGTQLYAAVQLMSISASAQQAAPLWPLTKMNMSILTNHKMLKVPVKKTAPKQNRGSQQMSSKRIESYDPVGQNPIAPLLSMQSAAGAVKAAFCSQLG